MTDIKEMIPFYKDADRIFNNVKRIAELPCTIPVSVYVETAIPAIGRMFYDFLEPDPKEVYHQVIGNSLYHDIKAGLEGSFEAVNRETSKTTRFLFDVADVVDVSLWYSFLAGIVAEGLIDASSQILNMKLCDPNDKPFWGTGGPWVNAAPDDGGYYGNDFAWNLNPGHVDVGPALARMTVSQNGFVAGNCAFTDAGGIPVPSATIVQSVERNFILDYAESQYEVPGVSRVARVWMKMKNDKDAVQTLEVKSAYTGGEPLPLHEMFADNSSWLGHKYNPR